MARGNDVYELMYKFSLKTGIAKLA